MHSKMHLQAGILLGAFAVVATALAREDLLGLGYYNEPTHLVRRADLQSPYNGYQYVGCWSDAPNPRTLGYSAPANGQQTIESCLDVCAAGGYNYAGLEYHHECYCGNTLLRGSSQVSQDLCNTPCDGDNTETCGGDNFHLSLYALANAVPSSTATALPTGSYHPPAGSKDGVTPGPYDYVGCYRDRADGDTRALAHEWGAPSMSLETCANLCLNYAQTIYFGVENGGQCFCDDQINPPAYQVPESNCDIPCTGDASEKCGSGDYINIYSSDASAHFYDVYGPVGGNQSPSQISASLSRASASSVASVSRSVASVSRDSASSVASVSRASASSVRSASSVGAESSRSVASASQASVRSANSASSVAASISRESASSAKSVSSVSAASSRSVASVLSASSRVSALSSQSSAQSSRASAQSSIASVRSSRSSLHTSLSASRSASSLDNQSQRSSRSSVRSVSIASVSSSQSAVAASKSSLSSIASVSRASVLSVQKSRSSVASVSQASVASVRSSQSSVASASRASVSKSKASVSSSVAAAAAATTAVFRYMDCYPYETSDPPLPLHPTVHDLTLQACANKCYNHTYWGVAAGTQCYCGDSLSNAGNPIASSNCYSNNKAELCTGNPAQKCGAFNALPIFGKERFVGDCSQADYFSPGDPCREVTGSKYGTTVANRLPGMFTGTGGHHQHSSTMGWNSTRDSGARSTGRAGQARICVVRTAIINVQLNSTVEVHPKGWRDSYTTYGAIIARP